MPGAQLTNSLPNSANRFINQYRENSSQDKRNGYQTNHLPSQSKLNLAGGSLHNGYRPVNKIPTGGEDFMGQLREDNKLPNRILRLFRPWGMIPDMAISATLRNIVPPDRVKELAWTARVFDATEALRLGIVTAVADDPLAAARKMAADLRGRSPEAIRGIKRLVNSAWHCSEEEALALEAQLQLGLLGTENQVEAVRANLERREPRFADRRAG